MRYSLGLSVLLTVGVLVPVGWAQLPGCRPTRPVLIFVGDVMTPILLVDTVCGDPDADVDPRDDTDADRLSDAWERAWFGNLTTVSGAPGALTDYDHDGRTDLEEWRFGLDPTADDFVVGSVHAGLTYDPRGQLTTVAAQSQTVGFGYDTAGNLRTVTAPPP